MPTRNRAWSSTMRILVRLVGRPGDRDRPVGGRVRRIPSRSSALLCSRRGSGWDRQPDDGAAAWSRSYVQAGADQLRSLAHELQAEVAAATGRRSADIEAAAVVADFEDPAVIVQSTSSRTTRRGAACLRTFCRASWATRSATVRCASSRRRPGRRAGRDVAPVPTPDRAPDGIARSRAGGELISGRPDVDDVADVARSRRSSRAGRSSRRRQRSFSAMRSR